MTDLNLSDPTGLVGDDPMMPDAGAGPDLSMVPGLMEPAPAPSMPSFPSSGLPMQPPSLESLFTELAATPDADVPMSPSDGLRVPVPPPMPARQRLQQWKIAQAEQAMGEPAPFDDEEPYSPSAAEKAALGDPTETNFYASLSPRASAIVGSETASELAAVLGANTWLQDVDNGEVAQVAAAELVERYATEFGDTPEFDFAVFDHLRSAGKLSGRVADLWDRFMAAPNRLRDMDADDLLVGVSRLGNIFDDAAALADVELDPDDDVERVVFGESGPMLFTKADVRLDGFQVVTPTEDLLRAEAPPGRSTVLLGDGRAALTGFPSFRNAVAFNKFTPVLVGVNDRAARWIPTEAAQVRSVDDVRRVVDADPGVVVESMLNTSLSAFAGRHPGLAPEDVVMFSLPDNQTPPSGFDWEAVEVGRSRLEMPDGEVSAEDVDDMPPELLERFRTAKAARRFAIRVPDMLDVKSIADEMELVGGEDIAVYARQPDVEGWVRYRERLFTDGVETIGVRSRDMDTVEPNSLYVWTKPSDRLPDTPRVEVRTRQLSEDRVQFAGGVEVMGSSELTIGNGVLAVKQDGRKVSRFAVDVENATLFALPEGDAPVMLSRNRDGSWAVTVDQSDDFDQAIRAAQLAARAGANVTRLRSPRVRASFQQPVDVDIPSQ